MQNLPFQCSPRRYGGRQSGCILHACHKWRHSSSKCAHSVTHCMYKKWTEEKEKNVGEQPCLTKKNYIKKIKFFLVSIKTEKIYSVHREVVKFAVSIGKPKGGGHRRFYWK